jgi:hypothetical protein
VAKKGGSSLGVDRRGRRSSNGVDCDDMSHVLIELLEYSYSQGGPSSPEAPLQRTSKLSVFCLEQFGKGDRSRSAYRVCMSEYKVRRKTSVGLCGEFKPIKL